MIDVMTFGGKPISDAFQVIDVQRSMAGIDIKKASVSGMDGMILDRATLSSPTVEVKLLVKNADVGERRERVRELSSMLLTKEPSKLAFASDGGLYYKRAIVNGVPKVDEAITSMLVTVTFAVSEAAMYGKHVKRSMSGTTSVKVSGTYPTAVYMSGTATPNSGIWGVRVDNGDFVHLELSGSRQVIIDSAERVCKVAGATSQITLDSDWIELEAGTHSFAFDNGSGSMTLEWDERWL